MKAWTSQSTLGARNSQKDWKEEEDEIFNQKKKIKPFRLSIAAQKSKTRKKMIEFAMKQPEVRNMLK